MSRVEAKLEWLRALFEAKHIVFGALSDTLTKEDKTKKWKELHTMAQSLALVPANKDYVYTRDTFWQNMRKTSVKKRDNSRKTGSGNPGIITKIDNAVYDIIGKNTPTLDGLAIEESLSQPSTSQSSVPQNIAPESPNTANSSQLCAIEKENIPPKRNRREEDNLRLKKLKLSVEYLEKKNYLLSLNIKKAEHELREIGIQSEEISQNQTEEHPSQYQDEEFLDEDFLKDL